ncbi:programmed cell death protein 2-like isoform X2 [Ptychodera flava]
MYSECPRPVCKLCGEPLYLVVQMYCPLAESLYHRTLYVFACMAKSCQNQSESWIVLRSQLLADNDSSKTQHQEVQEHHAAMATSDWCDEADDWGDDGEDGISVVAKFDNLGSEDKSKVDDRNCENTIAADRLHTAVQAVEKLSLEQSEHSQGDRPWFKGYFINVIEEETLPANGDLTQHEQKLLAEYEEREGISVLDFEMDSCTRPKSGASEKYEKVTAKHGDKIFQKFLKRVSSCPDQCLRYEWDGHPLLMTAIEEHSRVPACSHCKSDRVFEVQLMPTLVSRLKLHQSEESAVDFGTVYIFTCKDSCWNTDGSYKYKEEFLILQPDPDQKYFK